MPSLRRALLLCVLALSTPLLAGTDLVKWRTVIDGEKEAKSSGKPILYFMTAEWCGPCHMMKRAVFQDAQIAEFINKEYIPVAVVDRVAEDGRNPPDVQRLQVKFQLQGFPTLAVTRFGAEGALTTGGWDSKEQTVRFLRTAKQQMAQAEKADRGKVKPR